MRSHNQAVSRRLDVTVACLSMQREGARTDEPLLCQTDRSVAVSAISGLEAA